jgi:hypothetical protein
VDFTASEDLDDGELLELELFELAPDDESSFVVTDTSALSPFPFDSFDLAKIVVMSPTNATTTEVSASTNLPERSVDV